MRTQRSHFEILLVFACLIVAQGILDIRPGLPSVTLSDMDNTTYVEEMFSGENLNLVNNDTQNEFESIESFEQLDSNSTDQRVFFTVATPITSYPYAVSLTITSGSGSRTCSGALLTADCIITSANCIYDATAITGRAGSRFPTMGGTSIPSGTAIVHPKYNNDKQDNNIALVHLGTPLILSPSIKPIKIAEKGLSDDSSDLEEKNVIVLGFGLQSLAAGNNDRLSYANMMVRTRSRCIRELKSRNIHISIHQNCLDTEDGTVGLCNQIDIGGPVIHKFDNNDAYTLVGVTNYRYACATTTPNLFTRVNEFYDWIRKYVPTYNNQG